MHQCDAPIIKKQPNDFVLVYGMNLKNIFVFSLQFVPYNCYQSVFP